MEKEEADGVLNFDFERGLAVTGQLNNADSQQAVSTAPPTATEQVGGPTTTPAEAPGPGFRRGIRQTVCSYWLRGLCMKGDACPYLHQLDYTRMPICRSYARYGECREPDCIFKHTFEDAKECHMYMFGFCPNGPDCRYKHVKLPGPVPSLEETYKKIQQRLAAANNSTLSNRYMAIKAQRLGFSSSQRDPKVPPMSHAQILTENERNGPKENPEPSSLDLQGGKDIQRPTSFQTTQPVPIGMPTTQLPPFISTSLPLPQGFSRYFVVKSCNRENLDLSVSRGMWATHRNNEAKLNEAFHSCDHVILVFSVNETGHFQGCAKMMSMIGVISGGGSWKYADGNARYGRNFLLKWLKLCELSFHKTWHLRNSYNENLPVKISRDCQELEPSVGEQLASLLYEEPDSDLMKIANDAESKRLEEAVNGTCSVIDVDGAANDPLDNRDHREGQLSEEDNIDVPIASLNNEKIRRIPTVGRLKLPFGRESRGRGRRREFLGGTYGMGYDSLAPNPAECFPLPGVGLDNNFPPCYPVPRYDMQIQHGSVGFGPGFGPVDVTSGMPFPIRGPPAGLYSPKKLNLMGFSRSPTLVGRRSTDMPALSKTRPRTSKLARLLTKVTQNGSRSIGRSNAKVQQKRTHNDMALGLAAKIRNTRKQMKSSSAGSVLQGAGLEAQHTLISRNDVSNDAAGSSSEDEAPRRSRYGKDKKRRQNEQREPHQGEHWLETDQLDE